MNILITGANGFIAQAISKSLSDHNLKFITRTRIEDDENYYVKKMSFDEDFSDALKGVDTVIHTAAVVHQTSTNSSDKLREYMSVNCDATLNLAKQAVLGGVKRFIFISTIKVNGESTDVGRAFCVNNIPNCIDVYGISKMSAENGLKSIAEVSDMELVIIRPPLVYGAGVKANFRTLLNYSQKNLPMPFGSVCNKRSFVYVGNLVDLVKICIDHPKAANELFLVSDDEIVSTQELYRLMVSEFGHKARIYKFPLKLLKIIFGLFGQNNKFQSLCGDLVVNNEHTKRTLDWKPPFTLREGIKFSISAEKQIGNL